MKMKLVPMFILAGGASLFATTVAAETVTRTVAELAAEFVVVADGTVVAMDECDFDNDGTVEPGREADCAAAKTAAGDACTACPDSGREESEGGNIRPPLEKIGGLWTHSVPERTLTLKVQHAGQEFIYDLTLSRRTGITAATQDELYTKMRQYQELQKLEAVEMEATGGLLP